MANARDRYNKKNYDQITLRVQKGDRARIQRKAKKKGLSVNSYIVKSLKLEDEEKE